MTVDRDHESNDDLLESLAALPLRDVSERRSRQLRRRCHAVMKEEPPGGWLAGRLVPALGGAWCLAYLVEIVRYTAAIYGYLGER